MIAWRAWWPIGSSIAALAVMLLVSARTPPTSVKLPPLPAAVHVDAPVLVQLRAETARPLFSPTRSTIPIDADPTANPAAPLPELTGIAIGGGHDLALVRNQKGEAIILHVGEAVDGWTVRAITPRQVTFDRMGGTHDVTLSFDKAGAGPPMAASPAPLPPEPSHP